MTFNFAPWAIDGARTGAGAARELARLATGGRSGVASPLDMRVLPLSTNGNGVRITAGNAVIENWYQSDPSESYAVSNPSTHTVLPADMPPAQPGAGYYLVCVVVGDPVFDQTDHPYMPSDELDPAEALTFEYVRIVVVPCSSTTTRFEDLGYNYPAVALARLEVPPNTTTITSAMIVDVRELATPRSARRILVGQPTSGFNLNATSMAGPWANYNPTIQIPAWATHVSVRLDVSSALHMDPETQGAFRVRLGTLVGPSTAYVFGDSDGASGGERVSLLTAMSDQPVGALAGTTQTLSIDGMRDIAYAGYLTTYTGQTHIFDVQFSERII